MGRASTARRGIVAAVTTVAALAAASSAQAVHWPAFGGDNGRSGYQPVDEGDVPLARTYAKTEQSERFVKSSIITSAGSPATQRLISGTRDGFVNLQILGSGAPVGPEAGIDIDEGAADLDVFGTRSTVPGANGSSVSFAETSTAAGLGQVFAVHNDGADIEIAQINQATALWSSRSTSPAPTASRSSPPPWSPARTPPATAPCSSPPTTARATSGSIRLVSDA